MAKDIFKQDGVGYIYKITNTLNNKIYVGQTRQTIHRRFLAHCNNPENTSAIDKAIQKYGKENFTCEEVEKCIVDTLDEREIYYINKLHSHVSEGGYNISRGGSGNTRYDYDEVVNYFIEHDCRADEVFKKYPKMDKETLLNIVRAYGLEKNPIVRKEQAARNLRLWIEKHKYENVRMYSKDGTILYKVFDSTYDAALYLKEKGLSTATNISSIQGSIRKACRGVASTYLGYVWRADAEIKTQKIANDAYFTERELAQYCCEKVYEVLGKDWDRMIEPMAGEGAFLEFFESSNPKCEVLAYDIIALKENIQQVDCLKVALPHNKKSIVITNPQFGRANKTSVQLIKWGMSHSDYVACIQPASQYNQNRTMKDTELIYSEYLGARPFSNKKVKVCFNIYHKCKDGHKQKWDIPGLIECRHIFRSGKYQHSDDILNDDWRFRVAAWGTIRLLDEDETCPNEVVFKCDDDLAPWLGKKLKECKYYQIMKYVTTPNLPAWRLRKWLYEEYEKEKKDE